MINLKQKRLRRSRNTRFNIGALSTIRLCIYRSNSHIYAQLIDDKNHRTLASASTLEAEVKKEIAKGGDVKAASFIGKRIADKGKKIGINKIAFDRSGYKYHGRVKALADSAREHGLQF